MKLKNGRITILFGDKGLEIELYDSDAAVSFATIVLDNKQTCQALSRLGYTHCDIEVKNFDLVGKKMEHKNLEFEMPVQGTWGDKGKESARQEAKRLCPKGWVCSGYFGSQSSFFKKDGKDWARCTMRKWV